MVLEALKPTKAAASRTLLEQDSESVDGSTTTVTDCKSGRMTRRDARLNLKMTYCKCTCSVCTTRQPKFPYEVLRFSLR